MKCCTAMLEHLGGASDIFIISPRLIGSEGNVNFVKQATKVDHFNTVIELSI